MTYQTVTIPRDKRSLLSYYVRYGSTSSFVGRGLVCSIIVLLIAVFAYFTDDSIFFTTVVVFFALLPVIAVAFIIGLVLSSKKRKVGRVYHFLKPDLDGSFPPTVIIKDSHNDVLKAFSYDYAISVEPVASDNFFSMGFCDIKLHLVKEGTPGSFKHFEYLLEDVQGMRELVQEIRFETTLSNWLVMLKDVLPAKKANS